MTDQNNAKTAFTIDEAEYFVEDLSDDDKTRLNLIGFATGELNKAEAMNNLMMIAKDKLVADLKANLENG